MSKTSAGAARTLESVREQIRSFMAERAWRQFHNPKDLAIAISIEAAELMEQFLWRNGTEIDARVASHEAAIRDELADIGIYLVELADVMGVDLLEAMARKLDANALKYPVEMARGSNRKYDELDRP